MLESKEKACLSVPEHLCEAHPTQHTVIHWLHPQTHMGETDGMTDMHEKV